MDAVWGKALFSDVFASRVLVVVPLGHIPTEEVDDIVDIAWLSGLVHRSGLPHHFRVLLQAFGK